MSNWDNIIENMYEPEIVSEFKRKFAKLLVKYEDDLDRVFASREFSVMFEGDTGCKLYAYNHWFYDNEVLTYKREVIESGLEEILPTEIDIALMILDIANNSRAPSDKLNALKEYISLRGLAKKGAEERAVQNVVVIGDTGSNSTWEEKLLKNQQELQEKGRAIADGTYKESES